MPFPPRRAFGWTLPDALFLTCTRHLGLVIVLRAGHAVSLDPTYRVVEVQDVAVCPYRWHVDPTRPQCAWGWIRRRRRRSYWCLPRVHQPKVVRLEAALCPPPICRGRHAHPSPCTLTSMHPPRTGKARQGVVPRRLGDLWGRDKPPCVSLMSGRMPQARASCLAGPALPFPAFLGGQRGGGGLSEIHPRARCGFGATLGGFPCVVQARFPLYSPL